MEVNIIMAIEGSVKRMSAPQVKWRPMSWVMDPRLSFFE
jgi:hypothetical protein